MGAQPVPVTQPHGDIAVGAEREHTPKLLDLVHLSCQTFGDPDLEHDVLRLFLDQAGNTGRALRATSDPSERRRLFHLVKGSARGVGAFQLAALAQKGENQPDDATLKETLAAIATVSDRINALLPA